VRFDRSEASERERDAHRQTDQGGNRRPTAIHVKQQILGRLNPDEAVEWRHAVTQAQDEGSFFIAQLHHCAVGSKR
jgi:predicted HAD superfamily Cof-like phosphohydrolase